MTDSRVLTFLKLCELMNFRKTAEALNLTQPAVTQHIRKLEEEYGCKLFRYENRQLHRTADSIRLERYARSLLYNEKRFRESLARPALRRLAVGATKTIGDYVLGPKLLPLLQREDLELEIRIDNTENLLAALNRLELDAVLAEGFVDKSGYECRLLQQEELVGICAKEDAFAGKQVSLEQLLTRHILLREPGSGTRAVFEDFLHRQGLSLADFARRSQISSFRLIEAAAAQGAGVSFVYRSIPAQDPDLAEFRIEGERIRHEFNCVCLKGACPPPELLELL